MIFEIFVVLIVLPQIPGDCPPQCDCKWKSGKESVICINGNLTKIPSQLDGGTQLLDLTGNLMSTVSKDAFKSAGLLNLQKIYLSKCRIRNFDRYAFRKLINLVELDLSYNVITAIPSHIFDSISELRELKLNGNPIQRVSNDAFMNVPQLVKLELTDCRISTLEYRAFAGLEDTLEWLKLDKNRLSDIRSTTVTNLVSLHGLELSYNPWNCSCNLRPLRQWMASHNVPSSVPPMCRYPSRIASKTWDKLSINEFACKPGITSLGPVQSEEGLNVTMACSFSGDPQPSVRWVWKNKQITNVSSIPNHRKLYILHTTESKSMLTIYSVESVDAGVYFCIASNKAGSIESNVTLSVAKKQTEAKVSSKLIFAGTVVALLFLLASCLLMCLLGQPRKVNRSAQAENYEKIEMDKKGDCYNMEQSNKSHPRLGEYRGIPTGDDVDGDDETASPTSPHSEPQRSAPKPSRELSASDLYTELGSVALQHILRKEVLPSGSLYTTAPPEERNYPDLVASPPTSNIVNYIGATLPRSKNLYPRVSNSQSPLLAGSRCGSSAGESLCSNRRFSTESRSSSYYRLSGRTCERSVSSLNLYNDTGGSAHVRQNAWQHPSLPTSPIRQLRVPQFDSSLEPSETPILNIIGSAVYDYHAAQLERFLEEYRTLQDQLNRMKETCEGLRDQPQEKTSPEALSPYCYGSKSIYNDPYRS